MYVINYCTRSEVSLLQVVLRMKLKRSKYIETINDKKSAYRTPFHFILFF